MALPLLVIACYASLRALISRHILAQRRKLAGVVETMAETSGKPELVNALNAVKEGM